MVELAQKALPEKVPPKKFFVKTIRSSECKIENFSPGNYYFVSM